ncbi:MAG TPA: hypothetical protein GXX25_03230 [Desulfotomaculum sp.]|nr:hypothetical protein [Desulfotomaculum sp.]
MEIIIASVILAALVTAFSAAVVQQARLKKEVAVRNAAFQLMENRLKDWSTKAANVNGYFKNHTMPYTESENNVDGQFSIDKTIELASIPGNPLTVNLTGGDNVTYPLYQLTVVVSWDNNSHSVSGTTLVAADVIPQSSGN